MSSRADMTTIVGLLAAFAVATAGCAGPASGGRASVPVRTQQVAVRMFDHRYVFDERGLQPGRVTFHVANRGETTHDLVLLAVPDDVDDVNAWVDRGIGVAVPVYRMADREPGKVGVFAATLPAGRYAMLCFVKSADGTPHYKQGMAADFRVGSPAATPDAQPAPSPGP